MKLLNYPYKSESGVRSFDVLLWFQYSEETFNAGRHWNVPVQFIDWRSMKEKISGSENTRAECHTGWRTVALLQEFRITIYSVGAVALKVSRSYSIRIHWMGAILRKRTWQQFARLGGTINKHRIWCFKPNIRQHGETGLRLQWGE
jgi:hypothetical protein